MTSFRTRVLSLLLLVFAAVPAFAQDNAAPALNSASSIGCLGVGLIAVVVVGLLTGSRENQDAADQAAKTEAGKSGQ